jgi:flagellar motor switch protein FliN
MSETNGHPSEHEVRAALASALAAVIGSKTEAETATREASDAFSTDWTAEIRVAGTVAGRIVAALPAETASALAATWLGEEPAEERLGEALQALWEAVTAALESDALDGLALHVDSCARTPEDPPLDSVVWCELTAGERVMPVGFLVELERAADENDFEPVAAPTGLPSNLEVILDIDLPLAIQFGHTEMTLASLSGVGPGSIIELDRAPEEPVDVMVNGRLVARGEVVVVSGNYGVRVTEVVSAADRLRSLGR